VTPLSRGEIVLLSIIYYELVYTTFPLLRGVRGVSTRAGKHTHTHTKKKNPLLRGVRGVSTCAGKHVKYSPLERGKGCVHSCRVIAKKIPS
jgi:hypothetical protein